jgi:hypothetical protein
MRGGDVPAPQPSGDLDDTLRAFATRGANPGADA